MSRKFRVSSLLGAVGALGLVVLLNACPANDPTVVMGAHPETAAGDSVVTLSASSGCAPLTWTVSAGTVIATATGATLTLPSTSMVDQVVTVTASCGGNSDTHVITIKGGTPAVSVIPTTQTVAGLGTVSLTASATLGCAAFTWTKDLGSLNATTGKTVVWMAPAATGAVQAANITATCGGVSKTVALSVNAAMTGSLQVTITGPAAGVANTLVTGPGAYTKTLATTTSLSGLAPGAYTITAVNVTSGGNTYTPSPASQIKTVVAGSTATAGITYAIVPVVTLSATSATTVNGLGAVTFNATSNTGCTAFTYASNPSLGSFGGSTWTAPAATGSVQTTSITATCNGVTSAPVVVTVNALGTLQVNVTGLPAGVAASIAVTGPGGYAKALTATTSLTSLALGDYSIAAVEVTSGVDTYFVAPASQIKTVTAGGVVSSDVTYVKVFLTLHPDLTTVDGLGAVGLWPFSSVNCTPITFASTANLGSFSGSIWTAPAATGSVQTVSITGSCGGLTSAPVVVTVNAVGTLQVDITGTVVGTADVHVTGPGGYMKDLTATTSLTGLALGVYSITASDVTSGGNTYIVATAPLTKTVTAGGVVTATVTYVRGFLNLFTDVTTVSGGGVVSLYPSSSVNCTPITFASTANLGSFTTTASTPPAYTWNAPVATGSAQTVNITASCGGLTSTPVTVTVN